MLFVPARVMNFSVGPSMSYITVTALDPCLSVGSSVVVDPENAVLIFPAVPPLVFRTQRAQHFV